MHAALLSCIISVMFYMLVTIHLIALLSFLLELLVYWLLAQTMTADSSLDYNEQDTYSIL